MCEGFNDQGIFFFNPGSIKMSSLITSVYIINTLECSLDDVPNNNFLL